MSKCIYASFDSAKALLHAVKAVKEKGYMDFDTYTPFPVHGMEKAQDLPSSKLPWITLIGGAMGLLTGLGLQGWVATSAYPLVISGKPLFSYQAFIPVTFELMVLFSAFATVFGMFFLNRLPHWYHNFFFYKGADRATSDKFVIGIESTDCLFDEIKTVEFLNGIGGAEVEVVNI